MEMTRTKLHNKYFPIFLESLFSLLFYLFFFCSKIKIPITLFLNPLRVEYGESQSLSTLVYKLFSYVSSSQSIQYFQVKSLHILWLDMVVSIALPITISKINNNNNNNKKCEPTIFLLCQNEIAILCLAYLL